MYSNAKLAKYMENDVYKHDIMYSVVNNADGGNDLFITYKSQYICDTEYFTLENEELYGKKYDIIIGGSCVYYDVVQKDKNIFPVNNIPFGQISYHPIWIVVKNIGMCYIDLCIKNKLMVNKIKNRCVCENGLMSSFDWPIIAPKNDFFVKNHLDCNSLMICYGMAGLKYNEFSDKNYYDDNVIASGEKTIVSYGDEQLTMLTINKPNDDIYIINKLLSLCDSNKYDICMHSTNVNMCNVAENVFEHILVGDAFTNMEFICNSKIIQIVHQKNSTSYVEQHLPFKKTNDGYVLSIDGEYNIPCVESNKKIIIHTDNNDPVIIKYHTCVYLNKQLRKTAAMQSATQFIIMRFS